MRNPYKLTEPAVISFSGGRTSGYMLWHTLCSYGGTLPNTIRVIFNNTGKERSETLDFVRECQQRWNVPITWLEYRAYPTDRTRPKDGKMLWRHTYEKVTYETASRKGEPFVMAIKTRQFLPNKVIRFCTGEMKIKTTNRFVRNELGTEWNPYTNIIGFRADEPHRVARMKGRPAGSEFYQNLFSDDMELAYEGVDGSDVPWEEPEFPLYHAGVTQADVMEFWASQPFDLKLNPHEGNCDLCFLKGAGKIIAILKEHPELADWWIEMEKLIANHGRTRSSGTDRFRTDRPSYADLVQIARNERLSLPLLSEEDELPCHCTD